eukprot:TRINITY_DN8933_c0_g2_i1.p1 TRINITY_DN8933_c0_g2~~TRINITY_DN8933_c0_g2_i1.p1  ORF type:complete len:304 (+),score=36.31 TRINITY_DN8933_c0_g2_i1:106-1017(+)
MTDPQKRKSRHRQTEAIRRERINASVDGFRQELGLATSMDQATVLELTLQFVRAAKAQLLANAEHVTTTTGPGSLQQYSSTFNASASTSVSELPNPSLNSQVNVASANVSAILTLSSATQAHSAVVDVSASQSDSAPSPMAISSSIPDLDIDDLTSDMIHISLDSFYLPSTVCMSIFTIDGRALDCNQATLSLSGAQSLDDLNAVNTPNCLESPFIVCKDAAVAVFTSLQSTPSQLVEIVPVQTLLGALHWCYSTACRLEGHTHNGLQVYLGINQLTAAPHDFKPRVWLEGQQIFTGAPALAY